MKLYLANPIYDAVFKYLMEDERIARTLISALLKKKVVHLEQLSSRFIYPSISRSIYHPISLSLFIVLFVLQLPLYLRHSSLYQLLRDINLPALGTTHQIRMEIVPDIVEKGLLRHHLQLTAAAEYRRIILIQKILISATVDRCDSHAIFNHFVCHLYSPSRFMR